MRLINTTEELAAACADLNRHPYVTVDTEFLREQTFWSKLCLIQMAGPEAEYLVDPMASGLDLKPFYDLMANTNIEKVFHSGRQDVEIVYVQAGVIPQPMFDTQVAAMVCGFGDSISYVNLVKRITGADLDKSSRFTDWSRRPLSDHQLTYALGDVTHLRDVYHHLKAELKKSGRTGWLTEEMAELTTAETYIQNPHDSWQRLKVRVKSRRSFAVLMELAAWREKLAQAQDVPRARILRDEALYDIANQAPTDTAKLGELRTLSEGFARSGRAREIVEAVKVGLARDLKSVPPLPRGQPMSAESAALVELLKVLLKSLAAQKGVASRLIATADDLERIATEEHPDIPALKGWRLELFGETALSLKRGEIALAIDGGEVVPVPRMRGALSS
jgi:ribonuclease D